MYPKMDRMMSFFFLISKMLKVLKNEAETGHEKEKISWIRKN